MFNLYNFWNVYFICAIFTFGFYLIALLRNKTKFTLFEIFLESVIPVWNVFRTCLIMIALFLTTLQVIALCTLWILVKTRLVNHLNVHRLLST